MSIKCLSVVLFGVLVDVRSTRDDEGIDNKYLRDNDFARVDSSSLGEYSDRQTSADTGEGSRRGPRRLSRLTSSS